MIVQEINLYQERFREKKIILSASHSLMLLGVVVVFLAFSSYWYQQQFQLAELQNKDYLSQKQQSTQQLEALRKKLQGLLANNPFDREIDAISNDIAVRNRIINFVGSNQFGSGEGFSSNLTALSEISVSNVWLSEISLAGDYMKLSGSAIQAENIPEYFNQFRQRQLFNGQVFDVFELERLKEQDWKVDFLIASRVVAGNE